MTKSLKENISYYYCKRCGKVQKISIRECPKCNSNEIAIVEIRDLQSKDFGF